MKLLHRNQNNHRHRGGIVSLLLLLLMASACSTTSHLPEGEVLYTGVSRIEVDDCDTVDESVHAAVSAALEVVPNSPLLGSAYRMSPLPFRLWVYNGLYPKRDKGLRHWLWNHFKSDPKLVSQVNPRLRAHAAEVTMNDEGYFDGSVTWDTIYDAKNPRKAQIAYTVHYPHRTVISSVRFLPSANPAIDSIIGHTFSDSHILPGSRFSIQHLEDEKKRLQTVLNDSGYYFYDSQYIRFFGDSTLAPNTIALRVYTGFKADQRALKPCRIDSAHFRLDYGAGFRSHNFDSYRFVSVGYNGIQGIKTRTLRRTMPFRKGHPYSPEAVAVVKAKIDRLNTFKYTQTSLEELPSAAVRADADTSEIQPISPTDTTSMLLRVDATYNYPWTGSLECKTVYKDNDQVGPGLTFAAQRRNLFHGGELLSGEITAGYEWMTGSRSIGEAGGLLNSYEFGYKVSLAIPHLIPSRIFKVARYYPVSTKFNLATNIMRRAGFFQMLKATGEMDYSFYTSRTTSHTFTPLKLSYSQMMHTTHKFDSIITYNRILRQSFANQLVPQLQYTYLYDNAVSRASSATQQWLQVSVSEAGGLCDGLLGLFSKREQGKRKILGQPFSQFIRATVDFRNYYHVSDRLVLATRLLGGLAYAYGNSTVVPYSEQFYIGGANSLRGFSIRTIGPGAFHPDGSKYSYMDQTGDVKMEGNIELRFPILGDIHGALFADAGNIWTMRNEESRSGGQLTKSFYEEIATDCGFGLRYDLGMLVVRFDVGVPLHDPTENGSAYYNVRGSFFGNLGYHLAIGYPF